MYKTCWIMYLLNVACIHCKSFCLSKATLITVHCLSCLKEPENTQLWSCYWCLTRDRQRLYNIRVYYIVSMSAEYEENHCRLRMTQRKCGKIFYIFHKVFLPCLRHLMNCNTHLARLSTFLFMYFWTYFHVCLIFLLLTVPQTQTKIVYKGPVIYAPLLSCLE